MNILWVSPECPYPANTGGRIGIWKRIENMSNYDNIFYFCIDDDGISADDLSEIKRFCKEVHLYKRNSTIKSLLYSVKYPYPAASRWNPKMTDDILKCCEKRKIDYVFVDFPQMYGVLPVEIRLRNKIILHQHNIEYQAMEDLAGKMKNPIMFLAYKLVSRQLKNYEKKIYRREKIALYTFVSSKDKKYFEDTFNLNNTYLLPVGADSSFDSAVPISHKIAFIGKMSYPGNTNGAIWFMENVWNSVLKEVPDARLYLVGKDPLNSLYKCSRRHKNVIVTGKVESVKPYYEQSQFIIVPLLSGGGVKVKLLEALGYGKLVVTTQKGIEGTEFRDGEHVLEKNNPEDFADACISLLRNPIQYEEMRQNAIHKIEYTYTWRSIMNRFRGYLLSEQIY